MPATGALSGTPAAIIERINADTLQVLAMQEVRDSLIAQGMEPLGSTPAEFGAFIRSEIKRLGEVVKASGAKLN